MNLSIFGTTCLILLFRSVYCEDPACVADVQNCAISFQMGVTQIGANNNTATCLKVNEFLECLDLVLKPCDLATRTSLLDAMNNLIDNYKRPPYNCVLSFADNFTVPECTLQIGSCAAYDLQAEASNPEDACRYHSVYVSCMNDNTTSCNSTDRVEIDEALSNSTNKFTLCPFNCYRTSDCETTTLSTPTTTVAFVTNPSTDHFPVSVDSNNETDVWRTTTREGIENKNGTDDMTTESIVINENMTTLAYNNNSTEPWGIPGNRTTTAYSPYNDTTRWAVLDNNRTTTESNSQQHNSTSDDVQSDTTTKTNAIPIAETSVKPVIPSATTAIKPDETSTKPVSSGKPIIGSSETARTLNVTESDQADGSTTINYDTLGNNSASFLTMSGLLLSVVTLFSAILY